MYHYVPNPAPLIAARAAHTLLPTEQPPPGSPTETPGEAQLAWGWEQKKQPSSQLPTSESYPTTIRSDTHLGPNTTPLATLLLLLLLLSLLLLLLTTPPPFHHSPTLLPSTPILTFGPDTFALLHSSPLSSLLGLPSDPLLPTLRQVTTFRCCPVPCTRTTLIPLLRDSIIVPTSDFDSTSA
ncbi:uncharacterized protein EI90DRAFT_3128771 [Cantharellus anzutake]|uniref:uncharacterized protein n=1 Tax=Cantharellus anzutake TaxID=1750568 RepID=UPI001908AF8A|nr:uncharacterized protein EI90DRAFT_3128771 [Cantharellus anzutake]KAF8325416.1 hypothetical protein EI90DRAFT_3128771 [Cantharellus anzutake]